MTATRGLLIGCGESAIRDSIEALERAHFESTSVERILLPGGCWWLAEAAGAATGNRLKRLVAGRIAAVEAVSTMLASSTLGPILLVGHQDCDWYRERHSLLGAGQLVKRIGGDLYAARDEIARLSGRSAAVRGCVLIRDPSGVWTPRELFRT